MKPRLRQHSQISRLPSLLLSAILFSLSLSALYLLPPYAHTHAPCLTLAPPLSSLPFPPSLHPNLLDYSPSLPPPRPPRLSPPSPHESLLLAVLQKALMMYASKHSAPKLAISSQKHGSLTLTELPAKQQKKTKQSGDNFYDSDDEDSNTTPLTNMEVSTMPPLDSWIEVGNGVKLMKSKDDGDGDEKSEAPLTPNYAIVHLPAPHSPRLNPPCPPEARSASITLNFTISFPTLSHYTLPSHPHMMRCTFLTCNTTPNLPTFSHHTSPSRAQSPARR